MPLDPGLIDRQRKLISGLRQLLHRYKTETQQADAVLSSSVKRMQDELSAVKVRSDNAVADIVSEQESVVSALAQSHRADLRKIGTLKHPSSPPPRLGANPSYDHELEARVSKTKGASRRISDLISALDKQTDKQRELGLARQALAFCVVAIVIGTYMLIRLSTGQAAWSLLLWLLLAAASVAIANSRWSLTAHRAGTGFNWLYIFSGPASLLFALYYAFCGYHKSVGAISKKSAGARDVKSSLGEIISSLQVLSSLVSEARYIRSTWVRQAEAAMDRQAASARTSHQAKLQALKSGCTKEREQLSQLRSAIERESGLIGADWSDPAWGAWSTAKTQLAPLVRIGVLRESQDRQFTTPAFVPIIGGRNLLIESPRDIRAKNQARQILKNAVQRLLATCAAGKVRFTFIDPTNSGENMAPFMRLKGFDGHTVGAKVWTEEQAIEDQLRLLNEHIEIVIEKYLSNRHNDLAAYNREAGDVEEPYRVLVVEDFPSRFLDRSVQRVADIMRKGNRCGVYVLMSLDTDEQLPYTCGSAFASELESSSTVVEWAGGRFVLRDPVFSHSSLELDSESPPPLLDRMLDAIGPKVQDASQIKVPFESIMPLSQSFWTRQSIKEISIPIGRDLEANAAFNLTIGTKVGPPPNVLIAGQVGTGKSNLLHVMMTSICSLYSPDEVNSYLLDMKEGIEFQKYAKSDVPHMRSVVVCSDREAGLAILKTLHRMFTDRAMMFKDCRSVDIDHIETYRVMARKPLPRVILAIDEYQVLFSDSDSLAAEATVILDTLLRQGRAYGIHIVLSTQSARGSGRLQDSSMDQLGIRIAMRLSDDESRLVLGDNNPAASHLTRVGEAIFNADNGRVTGNKRIQIARLEPNRQKAYLDRIASMASRSPYRPDQPRIVFDAKTPADVDSCGGLVRLLGRPHTVRIPTEVDLWLGEPMDLEPSALSLEHQSGHNLLVIGSNQEVVAGLFCVSLASILLQYPREFIKVVVIDLMDRSSRFAPMIDLLRTALPGRLEVVQPGAVSFSLSKMGEALRSRDRLGPDERQTAIVHRYVFVLGLQKARELAEGDLNSDEDNHTREFVDILRDGPELGTHLWVWCEDFPSFRAKVGSDSLRQFQKRVVLQVSQEDSYEVTNSYAASGIGDQRALFYDSRRNHLRKIKPFPVPQKQWLQRVIERISGSGVVSPTSGARTRPAKTEAAAGQRAARSVPQPRCPCLLLIDTSRFMGDEALRSLSNGLQVFKEVVQGDPLASTAVDLAVVTFDSKVRVIHDLVGRDFQAVKFTAQGSSCMVGAGINNALDLIQARRSHYESGMMTYHRPWVFMVTAGRFQSESADVIEAAKARIRKEEADRRLAFFTVTTDAATVDMLKEIGARAPAHTVAPNFEAMFRWLAASMILRCNSKQDAPVSLPPSDWRTG